MSTEPQRHLSARERRRIGLGQAQLPPLAPTAPAVKMPKPRRRRRAQPPDASAAALRQARYLERGVVVTLADVERELKREVAAMVARVTLSPIYRRIPEPRFLQRRTIQ